MVLRHNDNSLNLSLINDIIFGYIWISKHLKHEQFTEQVIFCIDTAQKEEPV
jgi:hypothetical protein